MNSLLTPEQVKEALKSLQKEYTHRHRSHERIIHNIRYNEEWLEEVNEFLIKYGTKVHS